MDEDARIERGRRRRAPVPAPRVARKRETTLGTLLPLRTLGLILFIFCILVHFVCQNIHPSDNLFYTSYVISFACFSFKAF